MGVLAIIPVTDNLAFNYFFSLVFQWGAVVFGIAMVVKILSRS